MVRGLAWFLVRSADAATLEEAWEAAAGAPERAATIASAERAAAGVGAARAAVLPKVAASGRYTRADEPVTFDLGGVLPPEVVALIGGAPDPIVVQEQDWFEAQATLLVPLVDADGLGTLRAAGLASRAAAADVDVVTRELRLGTARAFHGARAAREGVALARAAAGVAATQRDVARRRVDAGDAPPRVLLEAEQAVLAAERDLAGAEEQRARAEAALTRLTGWPADTPLDLGAPAPTPTPRPELAAADLRAEAAAAARSAVLLGWAPDLTARATTQWTQNEGFAPDGVFVYAGAEVSWTFDGGWRSARARDAAAQVAAAEAGAELARRRAVEDRAVAAAAATRAAAAAAAAERERDVAAQRWDEAQRAFTEGALSFSDWDRAALAWHAAGVAAARERELAALAAVELALAGG
jgi:outer membrane protein TolC